MSGRNSVILSVTKNHRQRHSMAAHLGAANRCTGHQCCAFQRGVEIATSLMGLQGLQGPFPFCSSASTLVILRVCRDRFQHDAEQQIHVVSRRARSDSAEHAMLPCTAVVSTATVGNSAYRCCCDLYAAACPNPYHAHLSASSFLVDRWAQGSVPGTQP